MKKSTIVIALGIFIIVTAFLGMSNDKMYQKQKKFETTDEIMQQLNNKTLKVIDENGDVSETNELKECFSERARLTDIQLNYEKIEIEKVNNLSKSEKNAILNQYEMKRSSFTKRRPITTEEPIRLTINAYDYSFYANKKELENHKSSKITLDLVIIDEGEGLVIDYIKDYKSENVDEDGKLDA